MITLIITAEELNEYENYFFFKSNFYVKKTFKAKHMSGTNLAQVYVYNDQLLYICELNPITSQS